MASPGDNREQTDGGEQPASPVKLGPNAYNGPTVKYEVNKTYHVTVNYDDDHKTLSMKVKEWLTGREIWSYYLNTAENLNGMNRIYTGSKGDYGMMGIYAEGYIDNVRLTAPVAVTIHTNRGYQSTINHNNPYKNTDHKINDCCADILSDRYTLITFFRCPCNCCTWHYRRVWCSGREEKELTLSF